MSTWGKIIGAASITGGVVAAAAVGGLTAQRRAVRRYHATAADPVQAYDALDSDRTYSVVADDGTVLHVEEAGPEDAPLTVIFAHGWLLRSGAWHFQRIGLSGKGFGTGHGPQARLVFFDQRGHGKSTHPDASRVEMTDLANDLAAVMATAAPSGPVVLIGHSMGGMALITLAGLRPELIADRVVGVGLVSTSASQILVPGFGSLLLGPHSPVLRLAAGTAARYSQVLERARTGSRDAVWLLTRTLGFARRDVPADLVDYLDDMISSTPVEVIAEFTPVLMGLAAQDALPALSDIPTVIICGDSDRMTPVARSRFIAEALPRAELVIIPGAGHMATLEAPEEVNQALRGLLQRAAARAGLGEPERRGRR